MPIHPGTDRPLSPSLIERWIRRVVAALAPPLTEAGLPAAVPELHRLVEGFLPLYDDRPVRDNSGGSGFNDSLTLYVITSLAEPALVVESGVHKGHATWLLRQACPDATIHAFDIDYGCLVYRDAAVRYEMCDWSQVAVGPVDPAASLAVFDDHVNQCRRVREAYDSGFRLLVFDDNYPADQLYATGVPPVPTLAMLYDAELVPGTELRWLRRGKPRTYTYNPDDTYGAVELIDRAVTLPDLASATRYPLQSGLTIVRLKPRLRPL